MCINTWGSPAQENMAFWIVPAAIASSLQAGVSRIDLSLPYYMPEQLTIQPAHILACITKTTLYAVYRETDHYTMTVHGLQSLGVQA